MVDGEGQSLHSFPILVYEPNNRALEAGAVGEYILPIQALVTRVGVLRAEVVPPRGGMMVQLWGFAGYVTLAVDRSRLV